MQSILTRPIFVLFPVADWNKENTGGLDLLLKAAQKTTVVAPRVSGQKKSKAPTMALNGSYDTPVIVGRGSQATLNLGRVNKQVSRRHAIVQWSPEVGAFQITVLGQNGVRINGTGYPSGQQTTLRKGDIVDLVGVKMLFRTPAGPSPQEADIVQDHHQEAGPLGMGTPQRSHDKYRYGAEPQQLLTPTKSSPMRDPFGSPAGMAGMVTPTARMRHKTLKYDMTSTTRTLFNSPPPSSDAGTEFGSSPVRPRSVFDRLNDVAPAGYDEDFDAAPDSPRSEASHFWSSPSSPAKAMAATLTMPAPRAPLGSLSLNSNSRMNVAPSTQFSATSPSPSPAPKPKTVATPLVPKVHKVVLSSAPSNSNNDTADIPKPKQKAVKVQSSNKDEDSENLPVKTLNSHNQKEKPVKSTKPQSQETAKTLAAAVESKRPMTPLKAVNVNKDSNKLKEAKPEKTEKLSKKTATATPKTTTTATKTTTTTTTTKMSVPAVHTESTDTTDTLEKLHKELMPKLEVVAETKAAFKVVAAPALKEAVAAPVLVKSKAVPEVKTVENETYSSSSSRESSPAAPSKKATMDYTEMIIDTLVFARKKKSMTLTELLEEMITSQPNILESQDVNEIKEQMLQSLTTAQCVGKITRKGKDAYNKPLENQWYYIPECDHNLMRKQTRQEVMPSARKCTLKVNPSPISFPCSILPRG